MIANVSQAAAPTNVVNSEQKQLVYFGVGSVSQTSQTFTVDQQPFYLSAYNLGSDDVITVQQVFGKGSGTEVASFAPVNGAVTLNQNRTKVRIDHPGRYQLLHTGSSALGTFTVAGGAAVMTSDPLGDLAEALFQIFTSLGAGGTVTATAPITLAGNGSELSPYIVGFQANTVIGSTSISVTGAGTSSNPYVITLITAVTTTGAVTSSTGIITVPVTNSNGFTVGQTLYITDGTNSLTALLTSKPSGTQLRFDGSAPFTSTGTITSIAVGSTVKLALVPTQVYGIASGTNTYTSTITGFTGNTLNGVIYIDFTNANTGAATLAINGGSQFAIQRRNAAVTTGQIPAGSTLALLFDGSQYQIVGAA